MSLMLGTAVRTSGLRGAHAPVIPPWLQLQWPRLRLLQEAVAGGGGRQGNTHVRRGRRRGATAGNSGTLASGTLFPGYNAAAVAWDDPPYDFTTWSRLLLRVHGTNVSHS